MKLLTKAITNSIPALYATDDIPLKEKKIVAKFFTPDANYTWYVFEGEELENGDWYFFGMVEGSHKEMGYFSLSEIQGVRGTFGLPVERDRHLSAKVYGEVS